MRRILYVLILFLLNCSNSFAIVTHNNAQYDVHFYYLDLDIETASNSISGNVLIRATSQVNSLDTFGVELDTPLTVDSAQAGLNGDTLHIATVARNGRNVYVLLPFTATINQTVEVRIFYHGNPTVSTTYNSGFWVGTGHKFSASPPYNAYNWFPCKQDLTDKADSSWFFITTDTASHTISNGILTNIVSVGSTKQRWEWKSHYAIDFYLISFVVGDFTETTQYFHPTGHSDSMPVKYYNYTPVGNKVLNILQVFSNLFGLYPFYDEKLGIATVNLSGGIENQTIIAMGNNGVEPHEITHQWFGDNVTCGSWKDILLNEGFARWGESVYSEFTSSNPDSARIIYCNTYETAALSQANGSVYGPADTNTIVGVFGNYSLYYSKAAMVINSLRFEFNNDSLFFLGLRNYQTQFRGKSALGTDLKSVMEATSGKALTDFFNQWYYGFGFPTFNTVWNQQNNQLMLEVSQTTSSVNTPLFKTPLEIKAKRAMGDTVFRIAISQLVNDFNLHCTGTVTNLVIDPHQWISNQVGTISQDTSFYVSGIEEVESNNSEYRIYPNPANNLLYIVADREGANHSIEAIIFDVQGRKVYEGKILSNEAIKLPKLSEGSYIVQLNGSRGYKLQIAK